MLATVSSATLLGVDLSGRVRPFHLVIALLTLAIGGLTAGEVMALAYFERAVAVNPNLHQLEYVIEQLKQTLIEKRKGTI